MSIKGNRPLILGQNSKHPRRAVCWSNFVKSVDFADYTKLSKRHTRRTKQLRSVTYRAKQTIASIRENAGKMPR